MLTPTIIFHNLLWPKRKYSTTLVPESMKKDLDYELDIQINLDRTGSNVVRANSEQSSSKIRFPNTKSLSLS